MFPQFNLNSLAISGVRGIVSFAQNRMRPDVSAVDQIIVT